MGQIRKVGEVYYIEFYARGLLYSQVAGPDPVAAQNLLEATEAKIAGGEALTVVREIDLVVFWLEFLKEIQNQYTSRTVQRFASTIAHFDAFLKVHCPQVTKLSQVTPSVIEAYKVELIKQHKTKRRKFNPKIVNLTILLLRETMEYGIKIGFSNDNSTLHIRLLPIPKANHPVTPRLKLAQELSAKGVGFVKVYAILKLSDIAKMMYYANLIPLSREDIYN